MNAPESIKEPQKLPPDLDVRYFDGKENPANIAHAHEEMVEEGADGNIRLPAPGSYYSCGNTDP